MKELINVDFAEVEKRIMANKPKLDKKTLPFPMKYGSFRKGKKK